MDANRVRSALLLSLALAGLLVVYTPALRAGFIWDDDAYVTDNETLRDLDGMTRIWFEPSSLPQYYPVVHTSFWVEHKLWEYEPFGYHLVNVLLQFVAALLAWRLLVRLEVPGAPLAAAIFALHPVHVESVAWVTERKNVLSGVFYLAAFLTYLRFDPLRPEAPGPRARGPYLASLVLFALALGSKTITASLPAAIVVVMWWRTGRIEAGRLLPLAPMFAMGAGMGLWTTWLEASHVGATGADWSLTFGGRCIVAGRALWFYLAKLAWPSGLAFIYPRWEVDPTRWMQWAAPAAAVGLALALWLARGRLGRGPLAAALLFAGTLFPALGFLNVYPHRFSYVADHFQYLASLAPIALFAAATARASRRMPRAAAQAAAILLCAALGARSWQQAHVYHDRETLWRATIEENPDSFLAHDSLGNILLRRGELERALHHYRIAIAIRPDDVAAANNLAWALATAPDERLRDGPRSVELAERAAQATQFGAPMVLDTLAAAYAEVGRFGDAVTMAERAVQAARLMDQDELAETLQDRLALYRLGQPYRDPTHPPAQTRP